MSCRASIFPARDSALNGSSIAARLLIMPCWRDFRFGIVQAECGAAWFKIGVKGREIYTPRYERGTSIQENPNAFAKAAHVIQAFEDWAVQYERETIEFAGGTIIPKAQIVEVRGGAGVGRANACDIFTDVRIAPSRIHSRSPGACRCDRQDESGSLDFLVPILSRAHGQECRTFDRRG